VGIAVGASKALEAAHAAGLVHRDIKPQNLMLSTGDGRSPASPEPGRYQGDLKLLDFGVATALGAPTQKSGAAGLVIFGTPEYMAPEQVAGEAVDGRADVYALGCVLYEMLTGERAFEGPSSVVIMGKQLRETPMPPRTRAQGLAIPAPLEELVMRAMAKDPSRRWSSATDMRAALERTLSAPAKRRATVRRALGAIAMTACTLGAAGASAEWARTHAQWLDADTRPPLATPPLAAAAATTSFSPPLQLAVTAEVPAASSAPSAPTMPALRDARAAARSHPSDPHALEVWARAALRAGELREARRAVNAWMLRDGTVEPRLVLVAVHDASGHKAEARTVLMEWLESHPDSSDARLELARLGGDGAPPSHESATLARK
jgi:serine/threonine-protein kinase